MKKGRKLEGRKEAIKLGRQEKRKKRGKKKKQEKYE